MMYHHHFLWNMILFGSLSKLGLFHMISGSDKQRSITRLASECVTWNTWQTHNAWQSHRPAPAMPAEGPHWTHTAGCRGCGAQTQHPPCSQRQHCTCLWARLCCIASPQCHPLTTSGCWDRKCMEDIHSSVHFSLLVGWINSGDAVLLG